MGTFFAGMKMRLWVVLWVGFWVGYLEGFCGGVVVEVLGGNARVQVLLRRIGLEAWREYQRRLGAVDLGRITIEWVGSLQAFKSRVWYLSYRTPPDWALAVAILERDTVVLDGSRLDIFQNGLRVTLRHELAHLFLKSCTRMPRYFHEGLSMWLAGQTISLEQQARLEFALRQGGVWSFAQLEEVFPEYHVEAEVGYVQSLSFVLYLVRLYGEGRLVELLRRLRGGEDFSRVVRLVYGHSLEELEEGWRSQFVVVGWWGWVVFFFRSDILFLWMSLLLIVAVVCQRFRMRVIRRRWEAEDEV